MASFLTGDRPALPAVEAVMSRALTAAEGGTDQPQDEQDDCDDPQHVEGEPRTEEDQDEKESKEEEHVWVLPLMSAGQTGLTQTSTWKVDAPSVGASRRR
jgi:hypothetical protein